jgi:ferrochelatase
MSSPVSVQPSRTCVLLVNLGTPDAPTPPAVRRYLKEFLSDPRVVEIPRLLWWPILNGIILNTRPRKSAEKYRSVWMPEGSPLRVHTERQAKLLAAELDKDGLEVAWAMRYGFPSIAETLSRLHARGCRRLLIVPLYPQYADSTTASVADAVKAALSRMGRTAIPDIGTVRDFHTDPGYIAALAASVREHWSVAGPLDRQHDRLLMSFHGLPRYTLERGDPYHDQCHVTARLLAQALDLAPDQWQLSFQSRFGRAKWLEPYTTVTLTKWGQRGIRRVDVVCPGFVSDCLETLEEIGLEAREGFQAAGGGVLQLIPCLNERPDWIAALATLARSRLADADSLTAPDSLLARP